MADDGYKNHLAEQDQAQDLGTAIQGLITDNIVNLNTAKIAQITAINGNKVSFKPIMKRNKDDVNFIVNNVMVAFQYSQVWQEQFKLKVGDIGAIIVIQDDISTFKTTGKGGECNTKRTKDINDAIFLPCSLYKTLNNSEVNYILKNQEQGLLFEFDNAGKNTLNAKEIESTSEGKHTINTSADFKVNSGANADYISSGVTNVNAGGACNINGASISITAGGAGGNGASLKGLLQNLADLLEKMASGSTSDGATTAPGSIGDFSGWKSSLNSLFS